MNTLSLINRVKYSKIIYTLYYYIGSWLIRFLKLFVRTDEKLIVFASFGGRKYDDSPKAIYEAMLKDPRFDDYKLVWAFMQPEKFTIPRGGRIVIDTYSYYKKLLGARVWVTNSSMNRGLAFTGKHTFEMNTWHGSAIKKMGTDINRGNTSFGLISTKKNEGVMLAQSEYDVDVFTKAFRMTREEFRIVGLPRNDELAHATKDIQSAKKQKLGIPVNKKVILYAPTFREYDKDSGNNVVLTPPINLRLWQDQLGDDYILLFRAHYEVARVMGIEDNDFVKNVSSYPDLNDLMIASDILVSDYSSIFFDYAIQGKPMLCYCYDYEKYAIKRGMYFDVREWLPSASEELELLNLVKDSDVTVKSVATKRFQERFVTEFGSASQKSVDIIYDGIHS